MYNIYIYYYIYINLLAKYFFGFARMVFMSIAPKMEVHSGAWYQNGIP